MARRGPILMAAMILSGGATAADNPLDTYRWKARVLVLSAADAADPKLAAQRQALASARSGSAERDLVTIEAVGDGPEAVALRRHLGVPDDAFRAVLIGKDGGAKLTARDPIPPQRLFTAIDAMPMRKDEEKRRGRP